MAEPEVERVNGFDVVDDIPGRNSLCDYAAIRGALDLLPYGKGIAVPVPTGQHIGGFAVTVGAALRYGRHRLREQISISRDKPNNRLIISKKQPVSVYLEVARANTRGGTDAPGPTREDA